MKHPFDVICDACGYEMLFTKDKWKNEVALKEQEVEIGNEILTLVYFACPKCKQIYKVQLQDAQYKKLLKDLDESQKRIRRNRGRNNLMVHTMISNVVSYQQDKINKHVEALSVKYSGTFAFATSENNSEDEKIIYLP